MNVSAAGFSRLIHVGVAICAVITIACGGRDAGDSDTAPPPTVTPGETAGTAGEGEQAIRVSGCVTKVEPDGYVLTSADEAIVRRETGTSGHHRDDKDTQPTEANRGAEDERLRHAQNPSAEMGRFRLVGEADRFAMHVGREVEVTGRVEHSDRENSTAATLNVDTIDATGPTCGANRTLH
jgi:hypothetical protein